MKNKEYIDINKIAELKGLKSNRSLRLAIQKGKYVARVVKVFGGKSYEILYSSLEPEIQEKLQDELIKEVTQSNCTALVPINNINNKNFITESAKLTALARVDIVKALQNMRTKYKTKKEADSIFLDLYNSGMYLPKIHKFIGSISIGTLHRWIWAYEDNEDYRVLLPNYKYTKQGEYNTILTQEMKDIFIKFLLHPNKFSVTKAIKLTQHILEKKGVENIPHIITFRRYAEHYKKNNYSRWILFREGEKAYHDKVEAYIERDISKLEVGDVLIADGHTLNFQVINPFTGKPTRATLVGFLDWKSTALVGYEIMMSENTQCIASALRNAIINLGMIPKVVYQDNGKAFKAKYFQSCDFDEEGFNGIYANLGIKSVFAKPYNARAKVIERFFLEFQEEFEKMMPSYIGTSIENKPAWMKRGEKLHRDMHKKLTNNYIPTIQELIKYIDCWLDFHNSKPCPNAPQISIKQCLNCVQKQEIDKNILNDLMMKTEVRTIVDADRKLVESVINQLIQWIYEINFADCRQSAKRSGDTFNADNQEPNQEVPVFEMYEPEDVDLTLAQRDKILSETGVKFTKEYFIKAYGLEEEDFDIREDIIPATNSQFSEFKEDASGPGQEQIEDLYKFISDNKLSEQAQKMISPLIALIDGCEDFNEAYELLTDKNLHSKQFEQTLQKALFLCELQGRSDGLE